MLRFRLKDRFEVTQCARHLVIPGLGPLLRVQDCGFVDMTQDSHSLRARHGAPLQTQQAAS